MEEAELQATVREHENRLNNIEREVGTLNKAIFTGNGQPSIMTRMASIETTLDANNKMLNRATVGIYTILAGFMVFVIENVVSKVSGF